MLHNRFFLIYIRDGTKVEIQKKLISLNYHHKYAYPNLSFTKENLFISILLFTIILGLTVTICHKSAFFWFFPLPYDNSNWLCTTTTFWLKCSTFKIIDLPQYHPLHCIAIAISLLYCIAVNWQHNKDLRLPWFTKVASIRE